jgi:transcriptional regulator with XRE-family HTH domain
MQRILRGMSQSMLGAHLGITFQQVQKYEKGTNRISASKLQRIAEVLGVTPAFFFEGGVARADGSPASPDEATATEVASFIATVEGVRLNEAFARISSPKTRSKIVALVAALAEDEAETPSP